MNIMLILLCLFVFSSVASFGDPPEQPATKTDKPSSAKAKVNQGADQQQITLSMIDGPDRILADLPAAPNWFRDKNWLVIEEGDSRLMIDAVTGDPIADEPSTALNAEDLIQAIIERRMKKIRQADSGDDAKTDKPKTDTPETEPAQVSPRLQQLLTDLGNAADESSLFTFNHDVSKLAFVSDKGFHVFDLESKQTKTLPAESPDHLVGKLDWVYQEELYGRGNFQRFLVATRRRPNCISRTR